MLVIAELMDLTFFVLHEAKLLDLIVVVVVVIFLRIFHIV